MAEILTPPKTTPSDYTVIGRRLPRKEDYRLLTGTAQFLDDMAGPGAVHSGFVRSPHPHARVRASPTERGPNLPRVVAAVSATELILWVLPLR